MATDKFTMMDLLEFDAQMARDSLAEPETLIKRDRGLRRLVQADDKRRTLLLWTRELAMQEGSKLGTTVQSSYDVSAFLAIILGIVSGSGLINALLHYDGTQPVNVIPILAFYAVLQIFLLINYAFKAFIYRLFKKLPGGALLFFLKEAARRWIEKRGTLLALGKPDQPLVRAFLQRLSQLRRPLLQNHGWKLFQSFGIACHGASLLTFIGLILFNDYTFGWRTTLHLDPVLLHRIVNVLAWPFAWLGDFTSPSMEVLRNSQFSRFQKGFTPHENIDFGARSTAAWWPFLALVIGFYGLWVRIGLWWILSLSIRRELQHLELNDFSSEALWQRLSEEKAAWTSKGPLESQPTPSDQALFQHSKLLPRDCIVLRWRDLPAGDAPIKEFLERNFALQTQSIINGNGLPGEIDEITRALQSRSDLVLVVAADPWELPGEALDRIRQALRTRVSKNLLLLFAPLDSAAGHLEISKSIDRIAWKHAIQAFRDPYLGLLEAKDNL